MTHPDTHPRRRRYRAGRVIASASALALLAACSEPLDFDMRGNFGNALTTSDAARQATADRPRPDDRGIISYPGYQVAVARRGDRLRDVADRLGLDARRLADFNGIKPEDPLRAGEIIALPERVAEPSPATGAPATGPIRPPGVDITTLAGNAIDEAETTGGTTAAPAQAESQAQVGVEPIRHKVERGETAYSIARLYDVTPRALADWNGLDSRFTVREGQYLLIPVPEAQARGDDDTTRPNARPTETTTPGTGTPVPTPPSSSQPLPDDDTTAAETDPAPAPDLGQTQTADTDDARADTDDARLAMPARGNIIRAYAKGRNDGIDIQAPAGSAVSAAAAGRVAAITSDSDEVPILVVKHDDNLLTIYGNVTDIRVEKGDSVSRGQRIAAIRGGDANYLHFEVREGFESVDPAQYLP